MKADIIPAIDLRAGRVVRLAQGDYARQTTYQDEPVALAASYAAAGAYWLHVVDLDGAQSGGFANLSVIEALARTGLRVQAGGGVRRVADVHRLMDAGVERVVVGSVAIRHPVVPPVIRTYEGRVMHTLLQACRVTAQGPKPDITSGHLSLAPWGPSNPQSRTSVAGYCRRRIRALRYEGAIAQARATIRGHNQGVRHEKDVDGVGGGRVDRGSRGGTGADRQDGSAAS